MGLFMRRWTMRFAPLSLILLLLAPACRTSPDSAVPGTPLIPPAVEERTPALTPDNPLYARLECAGCANDCTQDSDCHVGGCSGEICSAQTDVVSTCEAVPWPRGNPACGCVQGQCIWYH